MKISLDFFPAIIFFAVILIVVFTSINRIKERNDAERFRQQCMEKIQRKNEDLARDRLYDLKEVRECIIRNRKRQEELGPDVKISFRWYDGDVPVEVSGQFPIFYHRPSCWQVSSDPDHRSIMFSKAMEEKLQPCPYCRPRIRDLKSVQSDYDLVRRQLEQESADEIINNRPALIKERIHSFDIRKVPEEVSSTGAVYISKSCKDPYYHNDIRCLGHMESMLVYKKSAYSLLYKPCPKCLNYAQPDLMVAVSDKSKSLFHRKWNNCISSETMYLIPIDAAYKRGLTCCSKCLYVLFNQSPRF